MKKNRIPIVFSCLLVLLLSASIVYGFSGERNPVANRTETMTAYGDGADGCGADCDPVQLRQRIMKYEARLLMRGELGEMRSVRERRFGSW